MEADLRTMETVEAARFAHAASALAREAVSLSAVIHARLGTREGPAAAKARDQALDAARAADAALAIPGSWRETLRAAEWAMTTAAVSIQLAKEAAADELVTR